MLLRHNVYWLILFVVTACLYAKTAGFAIISFDDIFYISATEQVLQGLSWDNFKWAFSSTKMALWHPLTWLSYQVETSLFGADNTTARHTVNTVLHIINVLLVYSLMLLLKVGKQMAFWIALLFSVDPQHIQNVVWISSRKELLYGVFNFTAIASYLKYADSFKVKWIVLSLVLFLCSLM